MRSPCKYITRWTKILRRTVTYVTVHENISRKTAAGLLVLWLTVTLYADNRQSLLPTSELATPSTDSISDISDISTDTHGTPFPVFGELHFPETDAWQKD